MAQHEPIRKRTGGGTPPPTPAREIPDKLYFRIGEVARLCDVPAYVLRFWEGEFPQLKPNKGGTGQRLFRRRDVEMALRIKTLLYDEGYTIPGARAAFKAELRSSKDPQLGITGIAEQVDQRHLVSLRKELQEIYNLLAKPAAPRSTVQSIRRTVSLPRTEQRNEPVPFQKPQLMPKPTGSLLDGLFDDPTLDGD
jgi:DNA-binding transcriptional MerR regulator